jgi:hypothetical protein
VGITRPSLTLRIDPSPTKQKSGILSELVLDGVFQPRFPLFVAFEGQEITAGDEVKPQQVGGGLSR